MIPLVDLRANYLSIKEDIDTAISDTLRTCRFIGGDAVRTFEGQFADFLGTDSCVACGNGTDAIELALRGLQIGYGDEVIVPAISWIATSEAVTNVGAIPVFADVDPDTLTIDPDDVQRVISARSRAIVPVHLYGCPADLDALLPIAEAYGLRVIEDCAQAHGAEIGARKVGTIGHAGTFSFFPGKNLGAFGDAGAVVTNDADVAQRVRLLANHGQIRKNDHAMEGRNSRMDAIQAAILSVKLEHLQNWNDIRFKKATFYSRGLKGLPVKLPPERAKHVFHLYVIQLAQRDPLKLHLEKHGIATGIHYPRPLPSLDCYTERTRGRSYPIASSACQRLLSLPIYPEITEAQQTRVIQAVKAFLVR